MTHPPDDLQPTGWLPALFRFFPGTPYRVLTGLFLLASFSHLWLEDAAQTEWMLANGIYVLGMVIMVFAPGIAAWLLCAIGLAIPLFFLRDQLTQSMLMLFMCVAAIVHHLQWLRGNTHAPAAFMRTMQGLTIATYSLATFHKLNVNFLDPKTSCANYGIDELITYYRLPNALRLFDPIWPWVAVGLEGLIAALFGRGLHRHAWFVGLLFHFPLTVTMAPAFVFVMMAGWAAFASEEDLDLLQHTLRNHGRWLVPSATALTAASLLAHGAWPEPTMIPREWLLWFGLLLVPAAFAKHWKTRLPRPNPAWTSHAIVGLFVLNGLTPYLGVQYQHAAAMLSNLRIDQGCWNHILIPESLRLTEDYIRVEHAYFGSPGHVEEYENILKDQLWNPPQMRQMQRNWCKHDVRPVYIQGTYRGRTFEIQDLCPPPGSKVPPPLPFDDDGVFGVELFPEFLRFQKNLQRQCPQACIH